MKLLIHAGIHRTGTTSLQWFLAENRAALAGHGILYPGEARNHQPLCWALHRGDSAASAIRGLAAELPDARMMILSAEDFCVHKKTDWLSELAGMFDTRAVFYLRRQDHWMMSWYNQHVKWPFSKRISRMDKSSFLGCIDEFHWLDYSALTGRWSKALGNGRVSAAVLEKGQVADVVEDFFNRLDISRDGFSFDVPRRNDSMPVHVLEIARHLGLFDLPPKSRTRLIRALKAGLADKEQPARTVFSPDERHRILKRFESSNREAARSLFGRSELFCEAPPSPDDPWFDFPDLSRSELLGGWIAPVIRELLPPP